MGLDVTADAAEEAKFDNDDIPYATGGSKIGWSEKGKLFIPKSREGEDLLSSLSG